MFVSVVTLFPEAGWSQHRLRQRSAGEDLSGFRPVDIRPCGVEAGFGGETLVLPTFAAKVARLRSTLRRLRRDRYAGGHGMAVSTRGRYHARFRFVPPSSLVFARRSTWTSGRNIGVRGHVCTVLNCNDVCRRDGDKLSSVFDGINTTPAVGVTIGDTVARAMMKVSTAALVSVRLHNRGFRLECYRPVRQSVWSAGDASLFRVTDSFTSWDFNSGFYVRYMGPCGVMPKCNIILERKRDDEGGRLEGGGKTYGTHGRCEGDLHGSRSRL